MISFYEDREKHKPVKEITLPAAFPKELVKKTIYVVIDGRVRDLNFAVEGKGNNQFTLSSYPVKGRDLTFPLTISWKAVETPPRNVSLVVEGTEVTEW